MPIPIFVHADRSKIEDLSDLLRIGRSIGKQLLKVEKVNIKPFVARYENGYLLLVEKDGHGRRESSIVGSEKNKTH